MPQPIGFPCFPINIYSITTEQPVTSVIHERIYILFVSMDQKISISIKTEMSLMIQICTDLENNVCVKMYISHQEVVLKLDILP